MKNVVCSWQILGWSPWAPRRVQTLGEGAHGQGGGEHIFINHLKNQ